MGIFDFFLKNSNSIKNSRLSRVVSDKRKAECPNCFKSLNKIPGAKTKCPHCGEFMFIRTRPDSNSHVVVKKSEADKIDESWRIINGTQDKYLSSQKRFSDRKELLKGKMGGREPSENDVSWSLLNENLLDCIKKKQWGIYSITKREMMVILEKENKIKEALQMALVIYYLNQNGVTNATLDEDEKPIEIKSSELFFPGSIPADCIFTKLKKYLDTIQLDFFDLENLYREIAKKMKKLTGAPLSIEETWLFLKEKLK